VTRSDHRPIGFVVVLLVLVSLQVASAFGTAGSAEDAPGTSTGTPAAPGTTDVGADSATGVVGALSTVSGPVTGARLRVLRDGVVVGESTTGPDGSFRVAVPEAGTYQVQLDVTSLPEGVRVANDGSGSLDRVVVFAGREKRINIDLEREGDEAAAAGPSFAERLVNLLVSGVRFGLVIALCAVGLTLIYATTGLVNFAHGELVTFGALVAWWASSSGGRGLPLVAAALVALVAAGLFGALQDVVLWQPLRRRRAGNVSTIVISIGLSILLRNVFLVVFDGNPRAYSQYATQEAVSLAIVHVQPKELVSIALCVLALLVTGALLRYTRLGTAVRATSNEPQLARASGVDVRRVVFSVWVAGAMLAGAGGVLLGLTEGVQWNMGLRILLLIFAAIVVGGLGSPGGALLGGLLIGVVSEVSSLWVPSDFKEVIALGALILVLLVRPQGITGLRERVG